jgi:hypothetical protein
LNRPPVQFLAFAISGLPSYRRHTEHANRGLLPPLTPFAAVASLCPTSYPVLKTLIVTSISLSKLVDPAITTATVMSLIITGPVSIPFQLFPSLIHISVDSTPIQTALHLLWDDAPPCIRLDSVTFSCPVAYEVIIMVVLLEGQMGINVSYGTVSTVSRRWRKRVIK